MFKQRLLVLIAAGAISIAAPFAVAQDDQQAPPPNAMQQMVVAITITKWTPLAAPSN